MSDRRGYRQGAYNQQQLPHMQAPPPPNYGMQALPPHPNHQWANNAYGVPIGSPPVHHNQHQQHQHKSNGGGMRPHFGSPQQHASMWQGQQMQMQHVPSVALQPSQAQFMRPLMSHKNQRGQQQPHFVQQPVLMLPAYQLMQPQQHFHQQMALPFNAGALHQQHQRMPPPPPPPPQQQQQKQAHNGSHNYTLNQQRNAGVASMQPPQKKQKKKDQVLPVEKLTRDPVVREPASEGERKEIEAWKAERRKNWPTASNVDRKEREAIARRERGELETLREERQQRLKDILARQQALGLTRKAGTEELYMKLNRTSHNGNPCNLPPNRRGGGRGRDRGRGRASNHQNQPQYNHGWEAFQAAGDAPSAAALQNNTKQPQTMAAAAAASLIGTKRKSNDQNEYSPSNTNEDQLPEGLAALAGYGSGDECPASTLSCPPIEHKDTLLEGREGGGAPGTAPVDPLPQASKLETSAIDGTLTTQHPQQHQQHDQQYQHNRGRGGERGRGGRDGARGGRGRRGGRQNGHQNYQQQQHQQQQRGGWVRPRPPSLLEKLLSKEIRQDRNYLLQAFRFFVNNNFLMDVATGVPLKFPTVTTTAVQEDNTVMTVEEILAAAGKEGLDIELSDEEEDDTPADYVPLGLGANVATTSTVPQDGAAKVSGDNASSESEEETSDNDGDDEEDDVEYS